MLGLLLYLAILQEEKVNQVSPEWNYTYRLAEGDRPQILLEGWVSNSRLPRHSSPKKSILSSTSDSCELITSDKEDDRCREKLFYKIIGDKLNITIKHDHGIYGQYEPLYGTRKLTLNFADKGIEKDILFEP